MLAALGGIFWLTSHPVTLEGWLRKLRPGPKRDRAIQEVRNLGEVHLSRGPFAVVAGASLVRSLTFLS